MGEGKEHWSMVAVLPSGPVRIKGTKGKKERAAGQAGDYHRQWDRDFSNVNGQVCVVHDSNKLFQVASLAAARALCSVLMAPSRGSACTLQETCS